MTDRTVVTDGDPEQAVPVRKPLRGLLHKSDHATLGLVLVGGVAGGVSGPAGIYPEICTELSRAGAFECLRLDYRKPTELGCCVSDCLAAAHYMLSRKSGIVCVGHSLGGAVVIRAALKTNRIQAVICLASQSAGTENVERIYPRPIFLAHGTNDDVLPASCSKDIYRRAEGSKVLRLYTGCGHCFEECRTEIKRDLISWLGSLALELSRPSRAGGL